MPNEDILTFEVRDEYKRKPIAENVIRLLLSDAQVSPMVIDGGWGTGKTEFCQKLIHLIESDDVGYRAVYVDAFKADHADEPLMTLLSAIIKLLPEGERSTLIEKALPAIRFGIKTTFKAGVSWLLKQDAADIADDFDGDLKKAGDQAINHAVESLLEDHISSDESIDTLKVSLKEITEKSPIVIFIDELDRCRPDFAVSMMESIKHVFDVDSVQFVLVTNSTQLRASINHCYGEGIDAQRYLDKFIGFSFVLPEIFKADGFNRVSASILHMQQLLKKSEILKDTCIVKDSGLEFIKHLIKENKLSLREVETFLRYLEIYQILTDNKGFAINVIFGYALLRLLGVFLFCFKPEQSNNLTHGIIDAEAIAASMGKSGLFNIMTEDYPSYADHADVLTTIVGFESTLNSNKYTLKDGDAKNKWEECIKGYFARGGFGPELGERVKFITEAIEILNLDNKMR